MRTPIIAGNWKMNLDLPQALDLVDSIHHGLPYPGEVDVIVAPTFLHLSQIAAHLKDSYIAVAAQDAYPKDSGAYTSQCSALQIKNAGADYVIIGHSERRQYFHETDQTVNQKIQAALHHNLIPIMCVGETLIEREANQVTPIISRQINAGLDNLTPEQVSQIIIAYEPIWAIGTGKTATPDQAEDVHSTIRFLLTSAFGGPTAGQVPILYGGSVKPQNANTLLTQPNIDGALVGGASLNPSDFIEIIKAATP